MRIQISRRMMCGILLGSSVGCMSMRMVTPAELKQLTTKDYPNNSPQQVTSATNVALKTMGFEVVTDGSEGRIKTAPKLIQVNAAGGHGYATTTSNSIAWSIEVVKEGSGTTLIAEPRMYTNGMPADKERISYDYMQVTCNQLFQEIDDNITH